MDAYVLDYQALLDEPDVLFSYSNDTVILSMKSLNEIEKRKTRFSHSKKIAREALNSKLSARNIHHYMKSGNPIIIDRAEDGTDENTEEEYHAHLIKLAKKYIEDPTKSFDKVFVVTNDKVIKAGAEFLKIRTRGYSPSREKKDFFKTSSDYMKYKKINAAWKKHLDENKFPLLFDDFLVDNIYDAEIVSISDIQTEFELISSCGKRRFSVSKGLDHVVYKSTWDVQEECAYRMPSFRKHSYLLDTPIYNFFQSFSSISKDTLVKVN